VPVRPKYFAWIDLETTGLSPANDPILEVGLIVTGIEPPFEEILSYGRVAQPLDEWHSKMGGYVFGMHSKNGLIREVEATTTTLKDVESEIIDTFDALGKPEQFVLAGSGVGHFDSKFIELQMPELHSWLHYTFMDVGMLRRAFKYTGRSDLDAFGSTFTAPSEKPHRGLDDVRDHLTEFRAYSDLYQTIPEVGPGSNG